MCEVEVWIVVDADGDYHVGLTRDSAAENYAADYSEDLALPRRLVKVTLKVPLPKSVELTGTVPVEPDGAELRVA